MDLGCPAVCCWAPWWVLPGGRRHLRSGWALLCHHWYCSSAVHKSSKTTGLTCSFPQALLSSAAVLTPSLNPAAYPELQPQWEQAHHPSLLPPIATNRCLCALMLEDLQQGSAPGIYTAVKNQSAIFTLGTQRQQHLCRGPWEVFTKNWASQQMTKGVFLPGALRVGCSLRKILFWANTEGHRNSQPEPGQQLRLLCRIEVRQSMFAPQSLWTQAKLNSTSNFGSTSLAYYLL